MSSTKPLVGAAYPGAPTQRLDWIDVAKGIAISLVVFYHVILQSRHLSGYQYPHGSRDLLETLIEVVLPLRMPLFFVISGVIATSALKLPWRELLRRKAWLFGYLFLVWTALQIVISELSFGGRDVVADILKTWFWAPGGVWYLLALALYFPLAKLLLKAPAVGLALGIAAYLFSFAGWGTPTGQLSAVTAYFVWFFAGAVFSGWVKRYAASARWWHAALAVGVVGWSQWFEENVDHRQPWMMLLVSVAAVLCGIWLAAKIAEFLPFIERPLAYVGRTTLPIYVMHSSVLWAWHKFAQPWLLLNTKWHLAYPFGATVGAILVCLGIYLVIRRPMWWLFDAPGSRARKATPQQATPEQALEPPA